MVAITERPRPALPPSVQTRVNLIQRINRYVEEHPKPFYSGGDVGSATGRSGSYVGQSIVAGGKVIDVARMYKVEVKPGEPSRLPLGAFIDAAFSLGLPDPAKQEQGRRRAKTMHGNGNIAGTQLAEAEVVFEADDDQTGKIRRRLDAYREQHPEEIFHIIKTVAAILECTGQTVRNRLGGGNLNGGRTIKGSWKKVEETVFRIGLPDPRRTKIGKEEARRAALEGRLTVVKPARERKPSKAIIGLTIAEHSTTDGVQSKPEYELGPLTLDEPEILHLARALRAFYVAYQLKNSLHTNGISMSREQFQSIGANIISNRIDEIPNLRQVHAGLVRKLLNVVDNYDLLIAQNPTKIHMLFGFFENFRGDRNETRLKETINGIFGVVGLSTSR